MSAITPSLERVGYRRYGDVRYAHPRGDVGDFAWAAKERIPTCLWQKRPGVRDVPRGVLKSATRRSARASQPALEVSVFAFARVRTTQNRGIARIRTLRGPAGGRVRRQRSGEVPRRVLDLAIGDERFPQRTRHFWTQHRVNAQNGRFSTRCIP